LRIGPAPLNLGGDYQPMLQLSNDDIIRLFFAIHPELRDSLQLVFEKPLRRARVRLEEDSEASGGRCLSRFGRNAGVTERRPGTLRRGASAVATSLRAIYGGARTRRM